MARPREFDQDEVVQKAMFCFWEKGYDAASIADLEKATGISRISLYNTFGNKLGLFLAVQESYRIMTEKFLTSLLGEPDFDRLVDFFEAIGDGRQKELPNKNGCLMMNATLNASNVDKQILKRIKDFRKMFLNIFRDYLEALKKSSKIKADLDTNKAAIFLQVSLWGASTIVILEKNPAAVKPYLDTVVSTIKSWRA